MTGIEAPGRPRVRPGGAADAPALAAIYNHYVLHTTVTFEEEPIADAEMARRLEDVRADGIWLVGELGGAPVGYAYAKPWHPRAAYRHSVESTIYLHPEAVGRGIGLRLYGALLEALSSRPVHRVIGVVALPNAASVALHERLGFQPVGVIGEVGRKFDRWIDVGYWSLALGWGGGG
jgi:phosphinothricin acetyltransferase